MITSTNLNRNTNNRFTIAASLAAIAASGVAAQVVTAPAGQTHVETAGEPTGVFTWTTNQPSPSKRFINDAGQDRDANTRTWNLAQESDEQSESVEVHVINDDITVKINGEEVPRDRIKRENGRIIILDENGEEARELDVFINTGKNPFGDRQAPEWRQFFGDAQVLDAFGHPLAEQPDEPEVMIGIHMDAVGPAVRKHLRLNKEEGVMVLGVIEGLPAHESGIGEYDVILSVDGREISSADQLRDEIGSREAGDVVELEIVQSGRQRSVEVEVVAYDRERIADAKVIGTVPGASGDFWFTPNLARPFAEFDREGGQWLVAPDGDENILRFQLPRELHFDQDLDAWREFTPETLRLDPRHREEDARREAEDTGEDQLDRLDQRIAELEKLLDRLIKQAGKSIDD